MDFVVVGFGLGALLMLAGFALRDLGPWLFGAMDESVALPEFETVKTTIRKQTLSAIGNAISVAGAGVAIVTFAALLARIEDDLGAIVVGMSLALACVGVGAWTYDTIRRFRTAMDVVSAQEIAVRERITPAGYPPSLFTPRPALLEQEDDESELELYGVDPDEDALIDEVEIEIRDEDEESVTEPDADVLDVEEQIEEASFPDAEPIAASAVDNPEPDEWFSTDELNDVDSAFEDSLAASWTTRQAVKPSPAETEDHESGWDEPAETGDHSPAEVPPLHEEPVDKLLDEAVRFEYRNDTPRQVPSWLFDDLETDLNAAGNRGQIDPVDQFHDVKPVQRGSALDRLLSDDETDESIDDPESVTKKRSASRFRFRDST